MHTTHITISINGSRIEKKGRITEVNRTATKIGIRVKVKEIPLHSIRGPISETRFSKNYTFDHNAI